MINGISDILGKNGVDSTNPFQFKKITERVKNNTSRTGARNPDNLKILFDKARKFSNGPRVTSEGLKKTFDMINTNPNRYIKDLGLEGVSRADINELEEICMHEEPVIEEIVEDEPEERE